MKQIAALAVAAAFPGIKVSAGAGQFKINRWAKHRLIKRHSKSKGERVRDLIRQKQNQQG